MSTPDKPSQHPHALRDVVALSGAVAGATLGTLIGPAGMAAGAAVGGAVGVVFGVQLERAMKRADEHDRELDDAIGVTTSELDSATAASRGLDALEANERRASRKAERELLELAFSLDHPSTPVATAPPVLEPPCPDCVAVRRASANTVTWCALHARHHPRAVLHYEYPQRFAVGSMLLRPPVE